VTPVEVSTRADEEAGARSSTSLTERPKYRTRYGTAAISPRRAALVGGALAAGIVLVFWLFASEVSDLFDRSRR
jgi:hypothetical protein